MLIKEQEFKMKKRVLIIGGYGNFGRFIAECLAKDRNIIVIIAGRRLKKAQELAAQLISIHPVEAAYCDIFDNFLSFLQKVQPNIVIHTSGPFQGQSYIVPQACIQQKCHYIDLADAREYVTGIKQFDEQAKKNQLLFCSGASSVPGLSSAVIDHYLPEFGQLESVEYSIATAQLTNQGLATTAGVLSYAGKPFSTVYHGKKIQLFGWQGIQLKKFWKLNKRLLGNCDVPDLDLFPQRYTGLKTLRFQAGLELKCLHSILYLLSWLVRIRLLPTLDHFAPLLLKVSHWFDCLGHDNTGFTLLMQGKDEHELAKAVRFDLYAEHGDGLYIPCIPTILLAKNLASDELLTRGATACVGLISLAKYLDQLKELNLAVTWQDSIIASYSPN